MAQERISALVRAFRLQYNDNYLRKGAIGYPGSFNMLNDYRDKDGEVFTAQLLCNLIVDAINEYQRMAFEYAKGDMSKVRLMLDEYVKSETFGASDLAQDTDYTISAPLPDNFHYPVMARFFVGGDIEESVQCREIGQMDMLTDIYGGGNAELWYTPLYWLENGRFNMVYRTSGGGPDAANDGITLHYMEMQPYIDIGGANTADVLIRLTRTQSIIKLVHGYALAYKNYKG